MKSCEELESFGVFLRRAWPKWNWDWPGDLKVQAVYQNVADGTERYVKIHQPRGTGKTHTAMRFILYTLLRNPNMRWFYGAVKREDAEQRTGWIRDQFRENRVIRGLVKHLYDRTFDGTAVDKWGSTAWRLPFSDIGALEMSVFPGSPESTSTGFHGDAWMIDDPVTPETSTPTKIRRGIDWYTKSLPILMPGAPIIDVGTPYTTNDVHAHIQAIKYKGLPLFTCLSIPPYIDDVQQFQGLDHEALALLKSNFARKPGFYYTQYELKFVSEGNALFHEADFSIQDPAWIEQEMKRGAIIYVLTDTATRKAAECDDSVIYVVALDCLDIAYVLEVKMGKWAPEQFRDELIDVLTRWNPRHYTMEKTAANNVYGSWLDEMIAEHNRNNPYAPIRSHRVELEGRTETTKVARVESSTIRFSARGPRRLHWSSGIDSELLRSEATHIAGDLAAQFLHFGEPGVGDDAPDAMSDLDACDKQGSRVCPPPPKPEGVRRPGEPGIILGKATKGWRGKETSRQSFVKRAMEARRRRRR